MGALFASGCDTFWRLQNMEANDRLDLLEKRLAATSVDRGRVAGEDSTCTVNAHARWKAGELLLGGGANQEEARRERAASPSEHGSVPGVVPRADAPCPSAAEPKPQLTWRGGHLVRRWARREPVLREEPPARAQGRRDLDPAHFCAALGHEVTSIWNT